MPTESERQARIKRRRAAKRRRNIRLAVLVLFVLALVAVIIALIVKFNREKDDPEKPPNTAPVTEQEPVPTQEPQTMIPETSQPQTLPPQTPDTGAAEGSSRSDWNLILVNPDTYIPDGYGESVKLAVAQTNYTGVYQVDERIVEDLQAMIEAAEADGIDLVLRSAFRTNERQRQLYNNRVSILEGQGYSHEEALKVAATINALPGTSEHETGLAVDILTSDYTSLDSDFDTTEAFEWLTEHCAEYGFIMRYPEDKTDITGIIYEPWHYRYVGKKDAQRIQELGITFEEYYQMLEP